MMMGNSDIIKTPQVWALVTYRKDQWVEIESFRRNFSFSYEDLGLSNAA